MLESAFRTAVLSKLPKAIHRQPMIQGMLSAGGTPDTYLDYKRDLWVEWKVFKREDHLPAVVHVENMLTDLQKEWLDRRWHNGRNAVVIVGVKLRGRAHGFVLVSPEQWLRAQCRESYEPSLRSAAELAAYLEKRVS